MKEIKFITLIVLILSVSYLINTAIRQYMTLEAIKNCSGSPSCIESTASVLLYKFTPCLDKYNESEK